ncbi:MAG: hypothetical protein ACYCZD_01425 [Rhodanobacter sp.]
MKVWSIAIGVVLLFAADATLAAGLSLSTPCQIAAEKVAPGFSGQDADAVVRELRKVTSKKSEYETDSAFAARQEKALSSEPLAIADGELCVVDRDLGLGNTDYDPESGTLWVHIFLNHTNTWFDGKNLHDVFQIYVKEHNRKESSYVGTNAFGASVQVSKTKRSATYVSFDGATTTRTLEHAGVVVHKDIYLALPLQIPSAHAQTMDRAIRVAYLYKLRSPLLATNDSFDLPKIDSPFEMDEKQTLIVASLTGIMIFDNKTGSVLKSIDLTNITNQ